MESTNSFQDLQIGNIEATFHESNNSKKLVVLMHGVNGSKDSSWRVKYSEFLQQEGFNVLRFDFSSGSKRNRDLTDVISRQVGDLSSVLDWIHGKFPDYRVGLRGTCLSSNITLITLGTHGYTDKAHSVAVLTPFAITPDRYSGGEISIPAADLSDLENEYNLYVKNAKEYMALPRRDKLIRKIDLRITESMIYDFFNQDLLGKVKNINPEIPILFIIGDKDPLVSLDLVRPVFETKKGRKRLEVIESRSHGYINPSEASRLDEVAYNWFKETL